MPADTRPHQFKRYTIDDDRSTEIGARRFYSINNFASCEWEAIVRLKVGESYNIGGGAAATFQVRRVK